jgi:acetyl-CoA carboxylase biotin carboxyl carrier protein
MSKDKIDSDSIRALAALLTETNLTDIEIEENGKRIRVSRKTAQMFAPAPTHAAAPSETSAPKREGPAAGAVTSPMVGTVYASPEPGAPPFVKVGDSVKEGDTLLIVEAMKTMNPILAPRGGTIAEICVSDAQPIEFGQTLLIIS